MIVGKFKSIQSVIFSTVAFLVLIAVVIVTAVSMRFTNTSIFENSSEYTHTIIKQMNQNIDSYIDYMENIAYLISSSEDVQDYLFDDEINNEARYRILNQFETILDSRSDIRNVGIISKSGRMLINHGKKSVNSDLDLNTQEWYTQALDSPEGPKLTSSHVQHIISGERPWVITLSRGIRDRSGSGEKEGVFFIDLNYSAISGLCDQSTVGTKGYAFILDAKGNIVYHPQQQQLYNELQTENIDLIVNSKEDTVRTGKGNRGKLYSISRSNKTGWTVVGCMSVSELLRKSNQAQSIYVLISALLMIVALLFSRFLAKSLTYPLQRLRDSMSRVQEGHFDGADVEIDSENEIGSLTKSFNVMTHRIQDLMEQNVKEQEQKRKIELKALQSQINPHFLYNTLDAIVWLAEAGEQKKVVSMVGSLSDFFRISLNQGQDILDVREELQHVRSYLEIQQMRYQDILQYEICVPEELYSSRIPKITLQPLVENALYHGIKNKRGKGMIRIDGEMEDSDCILRITDNGRGMTPERLGQVREGIRNRNACETEIYGLYNVNERIRLNFGEKYGITITSTYGEGTCVTVRLPEYTL